MRNMSSFNDKLENSPKKITQENNSELIKATHKHQIIQMSESLAHDFNNLLGIIIAKAQMLMRKSYEPENITGLKVIEKAAKEGALIIHKFQKFSQDINLSELIEINLTEIVEESLDYTRTIIRDKNQYYNKNLKILQSFKELSPIIGYKNEIRDFFSNMFLSVFETLPNYSTIHIETQKSVDKNMISVSEISGCLNKSVFEKVIENLFNDSNIDLTNTNIKSNYYKRIIDKHKINIRIDKHDKFNMNSLIIEFPLNLKESIESYGVAAESFLSKASILVIDDEKEMRDVIEDILCNEGNHNVFTADGGAKALEIFKNENIDIVLTDLGMPEMNGWEVAGKIREIDKNIPIILVTGWGVKIDHKKILENRINFVVNKPFNVENILNIISEELNKRKFN